MPFAEPWREFTAGDLVYGINEVEGREGYIRAGPFMETAESRGKRTIDEYALLKTEVDSRKREGIKPTPDELEFGRALTKHSRYKDAVNGPDTNEAVRHKVKGGLYWATMVKGKYVHFVLDGIDIESVVRKNHSGKVKDRKEPGKEKVRSITGAELRWIYRHRENSEVRKYIQFWYKRKQCVPPWESYPMVKPTSDKVTWSTRPQADGLWAQYGKPALIPIHRDNTNEEEMGMQRLRPAGASKPSGCTIL